MPPLEGDGKRPRRSQFKAAPGSQRNNAHGANCHSPGRRTKTLEHDTASPGKLADNQHRRHSRRSAGKHCAGRILYRNRSAGRSPPRDPAEVQQRYDSFPKYCGSKFPISMSHSRFFCRPVGVPFGSDASKLARIGIPSIVLGPGSIDQTRRLRAPKSSLLVALTGLGYASRQSRVPPALQVPDPWVYPA